MTTFTHFSYDEFVAAVLAIAAEIGERGWRPDFLIGIGRGGLTPAVFLSHATDIPMLSVDVSAAVPAFSGDLLAKLARRTAAGERLLFVDDINDSGGTIRALRQGIVAAGGDLANTRFATLLDNVCSIERVEYAFRPVDRARQKDWFVFPWESVAPAAQLAQDAAVVPERIA